MRRTIFFILLLLACLDIMAQKKKKKDPEENWVRMSRPFGDRYRQTIPEFGYEKVEKLVEAADSIKQYFSAGKLSQQTVDLLSPEEKFTWCMGFPESFMQICTLFHYDSVDYKIFAHLPMVEVGAQMSTRQWDFLKQERALTIRLMRQSISDSVFIGLNYKEVIRDLLVVELIPEVISNYNRTKDKDLLTLLIELMEKQQHQTWLSSSLRFELDQQSRLPRYKRAVPFTSNNAYHILKYAMEK